MKKFVPALFALIFAPAAFADVGDFGSELQNASGRIYQILEQVGEVGGENGGGGGGGFEPGPGNGGGGDPWTFEDDRRAVPLYKKSADGLGNAGGTFITAQVLENQGRFQEAVIRKTQACSRVNIALADLASANYFAAQPGFSTKLKAFGPELGELLAGIRSNRDIYCNF